MKFLWSFILLGLAGTAYGGGQSQCGPISTSFLSLLQASEGIIERAVQSSYFVGHDYPGIIETFLRNLQCKVNLTTLMLANGTGQLSGVSVDYILGILNGSVVAPFASPLDCITNPLLSFISILTNVSSNVIPEVRSFKVVSPISSTSTCAAILKYILHYYQGADIITGKQTQILIDNLNAFTSIGLNNLYMQYNDQFLNCGSSSIPSFISELLNLDLAIVEAFITNQTSLPPPYNCAQSLITGINNTVTSSINNFNNSINNPSSSASESTSTSPSYICPSQSAEFLAFSPVWINYINDLQEYALNSTIAHPELATFFIADFLCEIDLMVSFAANVTSAIYGLDYETMMDIINGTLSPPFADQINCIATELIDMRNFISNMKIFFLPSLESLAVISSSNTSTCLTTYNSLKPYVNILANLLNSKASLVNRGNIAFTNINMHDLYMDKFASIIQCLPNLLGKYVGAVLNRDARSVSLFVSGQLFTLPYPFSCAKIIINILSSLMNQALVSFITETPINLFIPSIPNYSNIFG